MLLDDASLLLFEGGGGPAKLRLKLPPLPAALGSAWRLDDGKLLLGALRELASTLAFEEMAFPDGTRAIARRLARPLAAARAALLTLLNLSLLLAPATPESGAAAAAGGTLDAAFAAADPKASPAVFARLRFLTTPASSSSPSFTSTSRSSFSGGRSASSVSSGRGGMWLNR